MQKVAMIVSSAPASRPPRLVFAVMFLAIVLAVGGLNARYLFQAEIYEHGDLASNSLAIREAKGFRLLHGPQSGRGLLPPGDGCSKGS